MKRLILIRHSQAEPGFATQPDFERALTRRGVEDAAEMARRLKQKKIQPQLILTSPSVRTLSTMEVFLCVLQVPIQQVQQDDRLYTAGPSEHLKVLRECSDQYDHVMIIAHNPGITEFADKLCCEHTIEAMPTSAIATMQIDIANWSDLRWHLATEVELDYPARA